MADFSPMMKQYFETKEKYPNTILFFRLGDFYEMFFNDAKTVSRELELTLTGRECGQDERAPMCGVPYHSAESYIAKLVAKGYKVAICEQLEDPKLAKGIVKRDVIRVITPGTVLENSMLDETRNNFICSLYYQGDSAGLCFADVSTGELVADQVTAPDGETMVHIITDRLARYSPSEILLNPQATDLKALAEFIRDRLEASVECTEPEQGGDFEEASQRVTSQFGGKSLGELGLSEKPLIVLSLGALLDYLGRTQINGLERLNELELETGSAVMGLDLNARRNLELTETLRNKEKRGSLLWVLDQTKTAMGKRLIKAWLEQPLLSPAKITLRQNAVAELVDNPQLLDQATEQLTGIYDLERIMTRIVYGSANGRELRSLCAAVGRLPGLKQILACCESTLLKNLYNQIDGLEDVSQLIDAAIVEEPPFTIREGGIIREGYNAQLDEIKRDMNGGKELIAAVEAREKERTGIPKLKTGYNRVFGYYIEVSNRGLHPQADPHRRRALHHPGAERPGKPHSGRPRQVHFAGDPALRAGARPHRGAAAPGAGLCQGGGSAGRALFLRPGVGEERLHPAGHQHEREALPERQPPPRGGSAAPGRALRPQRRGHGHERQPGGHYHRAQHGGQVHLYAADRHHHHHGTDRLFCPRRCGGDRYRGRHFHPGWGFR